ncbi:TolC family protein [Legionella sp. CNM-1927-20]|uniref:TolC family protein n=1 Tax=Legionella sp. CNM-1927-20 TaxID=3422221 RepID=UPI00403AA289
MASHILTFQQALVLACANNPELKAEMDKARAMKGFFIQSKQYPNPTVLLEAENIGGSGSYQGFESAETTLSVFQPIPLGNRLQYAQFATLADYIASLASIAVQQSRLYIAVGTAYIDTLNASQWYQITKKLTRLNEQIVTEINRRVIAGAGSQLDLKLAQIRLGIARIQEKRAYRDRVISRTKLDRLIGKQLSPKEKLTYRGLVHQQGTWGPISQRIDCSPSIKEKLLRLKAKRATITSVKKNIWPNLTLQLGVRHFSDDGSNAAVISASAPLPVFDKNQGKIATEEAGYTQIWHEIQGLRLELKQNLYALFLQGKQSYYELQEVRQSLLPLARRAVSLARQGYQQGRYTYIELANAITVLYEEEKHFQQVHAENHKVAIQINGLLGVCKTQDVK